MFRIVCDPPSGSTELCFTEITLSIPSPSCRTHTPQVQNYAAKHRPSTRKISVNHYEQFQSSTAQYWIAHDPKHDGVIFSCLLKLTQHRFLSLSFI